MYILIVLLIILIGFIIVSDNRKELFVTMAVNNINIDDYLSKETTFEQIKEKMDKLTTIQKSELISKIYQHQGMKKGQLNSLKTQIKTLQDRKDEVETEIQQLKDEKQVLLNGPNTASVDEIRINDSNIRNKENILSDILNQLTGLSEDKSEVELNILQIDSKINFIKALYKNPNSDPLSINKDKIITISIGANRLRLTNILYTATNLEIDTDIDCDNLDPCDGENMVCMQKDNGFKCVKKIPNVFYELLKNISLSSGISTNSCIELLGVNSLDINFQFSIIFKELDNYCIVRSQLNIWELGVSKVGSNYVFELVSRYNKGVKTDNVIKTDPFTFNIKTDVIYNIGISVKNNNIGCRIIDLYNKSEIRNLSFEERISCLEDNDCNIFNVNGRCDQTDIKNKLCNYSTSPHGIIFSKPSNELIGIQEHMYSLIGNLKFDNKLINKDSCGFENNEPNISKCKEKCMEYNGCFKEDCDKKCSKCKFDSTKIFSRNVDHCLERCLEHKGCSNDDCLDQCKNCGENCYWNNETNKINKSVIPRIIVKNISFDGKKAFIKWKFSNPNNNILGYVCVIYETHRKKDGVMLHKVDLFNCNKYCTYVIDGLKPSTSYTLGVKSYSTEGLSEISNLVRFKTIKAEINTKNLSNVNVSDYEVGNFDGHYCNLK